MGDAAAQCCPLGLPGLRFVVNWRSWKAEEGGIFKGEEKCRKVGAGGEKLPRRRQAGLPQGCQDKILEHAGSGLQQREVGKDENTFWFQDSPWTPAPVRI